MMAWLLAMYEAALWRHRVLVELTVPEADRPRAHAEHRAFVDAVYGIPTITLR